MGSFRFRYEASVSAKDIDSAKKKFLESIDQSDMTQKKLDYHWNDMAWHPMNFETKVKRKKASEPSPTYLVKVYYISTAGVEATAGSYRDFEEFKHKFGRLNFSKLAPGAAVRISINELHNFQMIFNEKKERFEFKDKSEAILFHHKNSNDMTTHIIKFCGKQVNNDNIPTLCEKPVETEFKDKSDKKQQENPKGQTLTAKIEPNSKNKQKPREKSLPTSIPGKKIVPKMSAKANEIFDYYGDKGSSLCSATNITLKNILNENNAIHFYKKSEIHVYRKYIMRFHNSTNTYTLEYIYFGKSTLQFVSGNFEDFWLELVSFDYSHPYIKS